MEELIIRVKIDGMGGGGNSNQNRSATRNENGALAAGAIGAALGGIREGNLGPLQNRLSKQISRAEQAALGTKFNPMYSTVGELKNLQLQSKGVFQSTYSMEYWESGVADPGILGDMQFKSFRGSQAEDFLAKNQGRIKAGASAMAWKIANSAVAIQQHRSGDSYANAQLSNAMKFAGYGTALAMSGPMAPFVAAGIAVNEAFNAVTQVSNYRFDRRQDSNKIQNIQTIAGDVSYGRNRGAY